MDEYYLPEKSDTFDTFSIEELLALVCFRLGDEQYALDIARVHEVLRLMPIIRVPQMPDFVLGIINARGNIIPVFDFRRKFGLGGPSGGPPFGRASPFGGALAFSGRSRWPSGR